VHNAIQARRRGRVKPWRTGRTRQADRQVRTFCCQVSDRLAKAGIDPSVGGVGDSCDNALAETINGLYKAELVQRATHLQMRALDKVQSTFRIPAEGIM